MSPRPEEVTCPECGADSPIHSRFCESCGLVLTQHDKAPVQPVKSVRRRKKPTDGDRREVELALAKVRGTLRNVRLIFGILAVLSLFPTILLFLAAIAVHGADEHGIILTAAIISMLWTGLVGAGIFFLYDHPLFWTITVAAFSTLLAIVSPSIVTIIIAVGLWCSLPMVLNIARLKKRFPALITSENLKRRTRRVVDTSSARIRSIERTDWARTQTLRTYLFIALVFCVVSGGIIAVLALSADPNKAEASGYRDSRSASRSASRPAELTPAEAARITVLRDAAIGRFLAAWRRDDLAAIEALCTPDYRARKWDRILSILEDRGWRKELPGIEAPEIFDRRDKRTGRAFFELEPRGTLKTKWRFTDGRWGVEQMTFSRTR